jgi:hypothetical protein
MPLGDFEREVLRVLAANRNPDSFIAGDGVRERFPNLTQPETGRWPCLRIVATHSGNREAPTDSDSGAVTSDGPVHRLSPGTECATLGP